MKTLSDMMKELPPVRRTRINTRAEALIAEEMTLRKLRKERAFTQADIAKLLGVGQDNISRLENREDMRISTLRGYIRALGGDLEVIARFPDRPAVSLSALLDTENAKEANSAQ